LKVHYIKKRPERSAEFEVWIRLLDKKREDDTRRDPSKRWHERVRMVPETQKDTEFLALPEGMPIDYFDPEFYNSLQPRLRDRIMSKKVSLLPDASNSFTGHPDEKLSDKQFMRKYAKSVSGKYNLVDKGELAGVDDEEDWIIDDDEEMADNDEEEWVDEDMNGKRLELAACLS
jgi:hypothetical protein